jgi:hypothetical protein
MAVRRNAVARTMPSASWVLMSTSARELRAEGDVGGYIWLPQWIGGKIRIKKYGKDVDQHN